jgi:hypothetical protein
MLYQILNVEFLQQQAYGICIVGAVRAPSSPYYVIVITTPVVAKTEANTCKLNLQLRAESFEEADQLQLKMMFVYMRFCLYKKVKILNS